MSEETTNVNAPEVPTPQVQEQTPAPPAEINLDSKITFEGKEVSVNDLIQQSREVENLREYRENATTLMQGENVPEEKREKAMRYLLSQEGYASNQIEDYINAARQQTMTPENTTPDNAPEMPQQNQINEQEQRRISEMEQRQNKLGVEMMRRDLDSAVERTMSDNPRIQSLIAKSKELVGDADIEDRINNIRDEVRRSTMDSMRNRKSRGETFDNSWFNQETDKAADAVFERIRSVIGDPDKIQRAPETASDADSFVNKPPVAEPTFEKGDNMGTATTKSHDWTVDALARLADETSQGGESRL